MIPNYLSDAKARFAYYKLLGDQTFAQVADEALFMQHHADSNSMAMIVKHLWGNMLSRWTDFLTTDGEKDWRDRDTEFENDITTRQELLEKWEAGWKCLFDALDSLTTEDLPREVRIRNEVHSVLEAINRQLAHYPYHVGQIVFIGKLAQGENWASLSIPKGDSAVYNAARFKSE